jgi:hypothetical protein
MEWDEEQPQIPLCIRDDNSFLAAPDGSFAAEVGPSRMSLPAVSPPIRKPLHGLIAGCRGRMEWDEEQPQIPLCVRDDNSF